MPNDLITAREMVRFLWPFAVLWLLAIVGAALKHLDDLRHH
ncbi:hypothetical protein M2322_002647 [Rhodoblastus acidophilus]|nr:hypothetical protein [Rhodoblastus acidophilus]